MKKVNFEKSDLEDLISTGKTNKEMCEILGCSRNTLTSYFKKYDIEVKKDLGKIFTKHYLLKSFYVDFLTQKELAEAHDCSRETIDKYIRKHKINYYKSIKAHTVLSKKDFLSREYLEKNRSLYDIATDLKVGVDLVKSYLKKHNIKQKPRYEEKVWHVDIPVCALGSGKTSKEIASEYGCSEEYVRRLQIRNETSVYAK